LDYLGPTHQQAQIQAQNMSVEEIATRFGHRKQVKMQSNKIKVTEMLSMYRMDSMYLTTDNKVQ